MEKDSKRVEKIQEKMKAEIWTWSYCPFCIRTKEILDNHKIEIKEHVMDNKPDELQKIKKKFGQNTVPIILINGKFIGGCDDLQKLEKKGKLN